MLHQGRAAHAPEYKGMMAPEATPGRSFPYSHGHAVHEPTTPSPDPPVIPPGYAMVAPNVLMPISALLGSQTPPHQQSAAYANFTPQMQVCAPAICQYDMWKNAQVEMVLWVCTCPGLDGVMRMCILT